MTTKAQEPYLRDREDALNDLQVRGKSGGFVINYHRDDRPIVCGAAALRAGLQQGSGVFGYFVDEGGQPRVITGLTTILDVEGRFKDLCVQANGDWFMGHLPTG